MANLTFFVEVVLVVVVGGGRFEGGGGRAGFGGGGGGGGGYIQLTVNSHSDKFDLTSDATHWFKFEINELGLQLTVQNIQNSVRKTLANVLLFWTQPCSFFHYRSNQMLLLFRRGG